MKFIELFLGRSLTPPTLPPFYPLYVRRFRSIARLVLRGLFGSVPVHLAPGALEQARAARHVVLYSNHPSFWDPLLLAVLTGRIWSERPVVSPIDERGLRQHPYFTGLGFFGLKPASAGGLRRLLTVAAGCWTGMEQSCLAITPEGKFTTPSRGQEVQLQRGLALALSRHRGPTTLVPVGLDVRSGPPWRARARLALGEAFCLEGEREVQEVHKELCLQLQKTLDFVLEQPAPGEAQLDLLKGGRLWSR